MGARQDDELTALRRRIQLSDTPEFTRAFPKVMGSRLILTMKDGATIEQTVATAKGDPENPMTLAELDGKFMRLATASGVPVDEASAAKAAILALPSSEYLDTLNGALHKIGEALAMQNQRENGEHRATID